MLVEFDNATSNTGESHEPTRYPVRLLQEEFDGMQKTARAFAARCRDLEAVLRETQTCLKRVHGNKLLYVQVREIASGLLSRIADVLPGSQADTGEKHE